MARLAVHVHLSDSQGRPHVFGPDDEVPEWAHSAITNPAAWAEAPEMPRESTSATPPAKKAAPAKRAPARRKAAPDDSVHG
ncbi:hypothetical protein HEK616_41020 [Streptomyces nigrescens]|uniref:Uncharacterized protein n=1 Tax=Streptomyces nigrescens TaxID=1920 RepID=A0ABM7ZW99_STRNI|nr:hypothetical protein HEK616_41020 [Streptomyces nigrescens]